MVAQLSRIAVYILKVKDTHLLNWGMLREIFRVKIFGERMDLLIQV